MRNAIAAQSRNPSRSIAATGEGKQHPGREVKVGIATRESSSDHDEIHNARGIWDAHAGERSHERASGNAPLTSDPVPRSHRQHGNHGEHIETNQAIHDRAHGPGNGLVGIVGLTRGYGNNFDSHITGQDEAKRQPYAFQPKWKESTMNNQIGKPKCGFMTNTRYQHPANGDEQNNR